ncbi:D-alanyl-D-alanine carboxypeptidase-like protein [Blastococcus colisei]|uniref:D-alanyl-D-alanine carboxypeptidase-like protein n=1 Tax=Blastococcus colisei TaxID=1564162 RepID=A0A543P076_9ACTN|nr:NlpC/P60 family protein [Blastococcus colisei]TQN37468.1 D-alanyl-D-alanine carboxypeptidase-like protein [Blastococcus colisei]
MPASRTSPRPGGPARPVPSAREAQALREALALRSALAAGQPLTPAQAAALRTATGAAVRTAPGAARTTGRSPARRPAAARSTTQRPTTQRPTTQRPATRPARRKPTRSPDRTGASWSVRLRVVALGTLLMPVVATLVLPGTDGTGPGEGPSDTMALALTAQSSLLQDAGHYRQLEQEVAQRRTELQQARQTEQAALEQVQAQQQTIGATAAERYRATPQQRHPLLGLSVRDGDATAGALLGQAVADGADLALAGDIVRAERATVSLAVAGSRVAQARSAVAAARARADAVLATVRSAVGDLTPEITSALAGLGVVPVAGPQQARNEQAVARWQHYLAQVSGAGIELPTAAQIADPTNLPGGLSPALDASGQPIPGVVWAIVGSSPVTVLPAETVAAVSSALSQLGKPYVPGASGPDTYDCGGFTSASWLLAGYAVPAPPQDQWATGAAVPLADVQVGDLVYAPGGQDVGIYLGDGEVIAASAGTYQVSVRPMTAGSSATRVTLPAPAQANAPLPVAEAGACGAALPPPGERTAAWGGWSNGQIPGDALCRLGVHRHALRCDAAASYGQLDAAYAAAFGTRLCITDSYRSLGGQVSAFARKPKLAAVPGTSNHGWALAVDLCGGINVAGSAQWTWMTANAARFGFVQPAWASPGGEKPEPWHWEYGYIS